MARSLAGASKRGDSPGGGRDARPATRRRLAAAAFLAAGAALIVLWQATGDDGGVGGTAADPGPVHVHGLGVNPADGAVLIATHSGLFRLGPTDEKAVRVGASLQDTMGFTVVGADHFLGSGHPDLRDDLPPLLGLIESTDAGESWRPVSLLGEADFHVLRFTKVRLYGYDATSGRLLASADRGRTWVVLATPGPLVDLAVDPADSLHLIATTPDGPSGTMFESSDGGASWSRLAAVGGLLAWAEPDALFLVSGDGRVLASKDGGVSFAERGSVGEPAAVVGTSSNDLHVALHDGAIIRSTDGGSTWAVRSTP